MKTDLAVCCAVASSEMFQNKRIQNKLKYAGRRLMNHRALTIASIVILSPGCGFNTLDDFPWPGHAASERVRGEVLTLTLVERPSEYAFPGANPEALRGLCMPTGAAVGAVVGTAVLGMVANYAVDQVFSRIEQESQRYEASFTLQDSGTFYRDATGGLNARCFRVTREAPRGTIAFDYIGRFEVSPSDNAALRIQSIYLNYQHTKARTGNGGGFAAVMTVAFDAVWNDVRRGSLATKQEVFNAVVPLGQFSLAEPSVKFETPQNIRRSNWFPAIPYSRNTAGEPIGSGNYTMRVTVSETASARDQVGAVTRAIASNRERVREQVLEALEQE